MDGCSCCKNSKHDTTIYILPSIGYGSLFDSLERDDALRFRLCDKCRVKINKWVERKLPDVPIGEFWKCEIIRDRSLNIPIESFKYEDTLFKLFLKFMPNVYFENNCTYNKYKCIMKNIIHKTEKRR